MYFGMYVDKHCCLKFIIKAYVIINSCCDSGLLFCFQINLTFKFIESDTVKLTRNGNELEL